VRVDESRAALCPPAICAAGDEVFASTWSKVDFVGNICSEIWHCLHDELYLSPRRMDAFVFVDPNSGRMIQILMAWIRDFRHSNVPNRNFRDSNVPKRVIHFFWRKKSKKNPENIFHRCWQSWEALNFRLTVTFSCNLIVQKLKLAG